MARYPSEALVFLVGGLRHSVASVRIEFYNTLATNAASAELSSELVKILLRNEIMQEAIIFGLHNKEVYCSFSLQLTLQTKRCAYQLVSALIKLHILNPSMLEWRKLLPFLESVLDNYDDWDRFIKLSRMSYKDNFVV